jgi:hypothetical protein
MEQSSKFLQASSVNADMLFLQGGLNTYSFRRAFWFRICQNFFLKCGCFETSLRKFLKKEYPSTI